MKNATQTFNNPILPGFYPDPSMCRVGDDYYLACSTFCYFPGVPLFHSTDLVHWEQIANILDRREQLELMDTEMSRGIFAPTLRYHDGTFYMITTNVSDNGNFIVTATDPKGPWSKPYNLESAGIDPSLFFDEDGKCYYCGTQNRREGSKYFGDNEIYIQELDLTTMKLVGESYPAWHGALRGVEWPEGPHIFKKDGWYYLMISEAGTGHQHAISIARSKSLTEPFEGNKSNPIMTHRHLGYNYPIVNVGHPDIVETQNGEWWMCLLASRPYGGYYRNLGRETFMVPFVWEDGWPVIKPGSGIVEMTETAPDLPMMKPNPVPEIEDFKCKELPMHLMYIRNPDRNNYSLDARYDYLRMTLSPETLAGRMNPSCLVQRQQHMSFLFETTLEFHPVKSNEEAGIAIFQNQDYNYQFLVSKDNDNTVITLYKVENGTTSTVAVKKLSGSYERLTLQLYANYQDLHFAVNTGASYEEIGCVDGRILCTDVAGGFVGNTMGIYATSNGEPSNTYCDFDYMKYTAIH